MQVGLHNVMSAGPSTHAHVPNDSPQRTVAALLGMRKEAVTARTGFTPTTRRMRHSEIMAMFQGAGATDIASERHGDADEAYAALRQFGSGESVALELVTSEGESQMVVATRDDSFGGDSQYPGVKLVDHRHQPPQVSEFSASAARYRIYFRRPPGSGPKGFKPGADATSESQPVVIDEFLANLIGESSHTEAGPSAEWGPASPGSPEGSPESGELVNVGSLVRMSQGRLNLPFRNSDFTEGSPKMEGISRIDRQIYHIDQDTHPAVAHLLDTPADQMPKTNAKVWMGSPDPLDIKLLFMRAGVRDINHFSGDQEFAYKFIKSLPNGESVGLAFVTPDGTTNLVEAVRDARYPRSEFRFGNVNETIPTSFPGVKIVDFRHTSPKVTHFPPQQLIYHIFTRGPVKTTDDGDLIIDGAGGFKAVNKASRGEGSSTPSRLKHPAVIPFSPERHTAELFTQGLVGTADDDSLLSGHAGFTRFSWRLFPHQRLGVGPESSGEPGAPAERPSSSASGTESTSELRRVGGRRYEPGELHTPVREGSSLYNIDQNTHPAIGHLLGASADTWPETGVKPWTLDDMQDPRDIALLFMRAGVNDIKHFSAPSQQSVYKYLMNLPPGESVGLAFVTPDSKVHLVEAMRDPDYPNPYNITYDGVKTEFPGVKILDFQQIPPKTLPFPERMSLYHVFVRGPVNSTESGRLVNEGVGGFTRLNEVLQQGLPNESDLVMPKRKHWLWG